MKVYEHRVQYYETDQMGIVHHSNYIRWFEEARVDLLGKLGIGYKTMEESGILSPVLEVHAIYKTMAHFDDIVQVEIKVEKYNGIVLELSYEVKDKETGEVRCCGNTKHCFLNREGRPLSLKKSYPEFDKVLYKFSQTA
ncbi:MAG: thioesterase family protein [Lachnospiraceae bacterium]|nr:acyl-CoA thioesterase [Robinsoniella sp.]MDY3766596.1 thioesterase family protein [Lachnospiraceae bacterium]